MVRRSLVTTADYHLWPKDKPVVFIGEWCKRFSEKSRWERIDSKTASYHWDDRIKLTNDSIFLDKVYEDCLLELSKKLNSIHNKKYSPRFWRILLGPWLGLFIQILFDRWKMLIISLESFNIDSCNVYKFNLEKIVPNDTNHFTQILVTDSWNEAIYAKILELIPHNLEINTLDEKKIDISLNSGASIKQKIKSLLISCITIFEKPLAQKDKIFLFNSGFSILKNFQIQLKFKQIPKIWTSSQIPKFEINEAKRDWNLNLKSTQCEFSEIVESIIPLCIPKIYLEGFQGILNLQNKLPWPSNPSVIFTSNAYFTDDVFKIWAASKTEKKSKLLVGQHGGNFGMTTRAFLEKHQIKISDNFLSWGWTDKNNKKIISSENLITDRDFKGYDPLGKALMVQYTLPRYSYQIYSVPIASQWLDYFDQQCRFIENLTFEVKNKTKLRLYKKDFGWDQFSRWNDLFPELSYDFATRPMKEVASRSRIFIATYNATTYLESLSWNMPTIIFWKPEHWELNDEASKYFDLLESVGIFHKTPESAANMLISIWDDIESWWWSDKVQEAVNTFCNKYSSVSDDSTHKIESIFKKYI